MEEQKPDPAAEQFDLGSSSESSSDELDLENKQNRVSGANGEETPTVENERRRRKRSGSAQGSEENNSQDGKNYMAGRHHHRDQARNSPGSDGDDDNNARKRSSYRDNNDQGYNKSRGGRHRSRSNSAGSNGGGQDRYGSRRGGNDYQGSYRTRDNRDQGGYQGNNYNNNQGGSSSYTKDRNNDGFVKPDISRPFLNFKQFQTLQNRSSGDGYQGERGQFYNKLKLAYDNYITDFQKEQDRVFLDQHQADPWFLEQYEPNTVFQLKQEEFARAQKLAKTFIEQIPVLSINLTNAETSEQYRFNSNLNTICLYKIPVTVARADMIETINRTLTMAQACTGQANINFIESLTFSEPLKLYDYVRYAYITFTSEEVCQKALEVLNGVQIKNYTLAPVAANTPYKANKMTPELPEYQIKLDLFSCKRLIKEVFDTEKNITNNIVAHVEKAGGSVESQLDYLVLYLRRVHGYCFYCGEKCAEERMLTTKCAPLHLRSNLPSTVNSNDFMNDDLYEQARFFIGKYDDAARLLLKEGPLKMKNDLDAWLERCKEDFCDNKTNMIKDNVFQCGICEKKFQTRDFVRKHIVNKHEDKVQLMELEMSVWKQTKAKDNFRLDENRITMVAQKNAQIQQKKEFNKQGSFGGRDQQQDGGQRGGYGGRGRGGGFRGGRGGGYRNNDRDEEGGMHPPAMNYQNSFTEDEFGRKQQSGADNKAYVDLDDPMLSDQTAQPSATMVGAIGGSFSKKATQVAFDDLF